MLGVGLAELLNYPYNLVEEISTNRRPTLKFLSIIGEND